ncbi:unnamed protein product, partial [Prunus brigantina]
EAVATSVLSKHWRYAWAWSTLTLDFDPEETLIGFKDHSRTLQNKKSHRYVNWVNRVVEQHSGPNIKLFRACFDLDRRFTSSIDKWIEFALNKRVQVLILDFVKEYGINKDSYMFPRKLLGLEEGFASRLVGSSIALKYLKLDECDDLKRVEISDTNLVSFIHTGTAIDLRLSNVPSLVEEYNKDYTFPILSNLKHLELTVEGDYKLSLSQLSSFMKASPYLQRLALKLRFWENPFNEGRKIKKAAKCPHHYIKVVEVLGYCDRTNAVEHVMFLMENVVALEKLVIDPYWSWDLHHSGSESGKRERKKEAKARCHANMHLKNRVPSTVEFVCL